MNNDLISREALKTAIKNSFKHNLNGYDALLISEIDEFIDNAPTVEPEKIAVANVTFDKEQLEEIVEKAKAEVLAVALDANERPQGKWIFQYTFLDDNLYKCSICDRLLSIDVEQDIEQFLFCPNCGASMRGDKE